MSLVALEIPKVGLVMENARLVRWLKSVGEVVKQGEPLLELETEKSVVEIESTESGRLVEILLQADQEARVGDRVAWLENDRSGTSASGRKRVHRHGAPVARRWPRAPPDIGRSGRIQLSDRVGVARRRHRPIKSSPVARRLAAQQPSIWPASAGTGPRGRVQLRTCAGQSSSGERGSRSPSRSRACDAPWRAP